MVDAMQSTGSEVASRKALDVLHDVFGFTAFRKAQEKIINRILAGGDALVIMPTGGGKSLCYQLPALVRDGVGIVVSPLIALMKDQVDAMQQLGVRATCINSSMPFDEAADRERRMIAGEYDLVYVAPERLCTPRFLDQLDRADLALFAIDEAHCVSQWGHDFRPEYRQLTVLHERFPGVPRLALTATADEPTRRDIIDRLDLGEAERFITGFDRPNIRYTVTPKQNQRRQLVDFLRAQGEGEAGIVYCMSRRKTEEIAEFLNLQGFRALAYHAGLDGGMRQDHQSRFLKEEGLIVVATIAFGMGIDKPDVRFVVHLDLPKSIESYYQETGRAGRDDLPAEVMLTYSAGDATKIKRFIDDGESSDEQKRIEHAKLNALLSYCETTRCRRQVLLEYFGDARNESCGNCDNCLNPASFVDGTTDARKALSNVYRTGQRFGAGHLADVLIGSQSQRVLELGHDQLSTYGIGRDKTRSEWMSIYRQLVALGLLQVDPAYGSLLLTPTARPVLRGEQTVQFRTEPAKSDRPEKTAKRNRAALQLKRAEDQAVFEALRDLRMKLAKAQDVPPYVVFSDRTLIDMARRRPANMREMSRVHGVGERKLERYGQQFLDLVAEHADSAPSDNDAEAMGEPDPLDQPDTAGLRETVAETLRLLQAGHAPAAIAEQRGLKETTIFGHLADGIAEGVLTVRDVLDLPEAELTALEDAFKALPEEDRQCRRTKPVFEQFEGRFDYGTLRCVVADLFVRGELI